MMSYQMRLNSRSRKAGRFIHKVHDEIQKAFVRSGLKQRELADKIGVDRSAVNKQLMGQTNLTLRSISDLAWAMDQDIEFSIIEKTNPVGHSNYLRSSEIETDDAANVVTLRNSQDRVETFSDGDKPSAEREAAL